MSQVSGILLKMDMIIKNILIQSAPQSLKCLQFRKSDGKEWKAVFDHWKNLKMAMRDYGAREPNFPEGLSEVAFCLWSGSVRKVNCTGSHTSFDTYNLRLNRMEQVKACSVEKDLTSFGPNSVWDDLYFLDFWNSGSVDGSFDVYLIPNEVIYNYPVNRNQSLRDQQLQGKRPRVHMKALIGENRIRPKASNVKVCA